MVWYAAALATFDGNNGPKLVLAGELPLLRRGRMAGSAGNPPEETLRGGDITASSRHRQDHRRAKLT